MSEPVVNSIVDRVRARFRVQAPIIAFGGRARAILSAGKSRLRIGCYNLPYRLLSGHDGHRLPPPALVNLVIGTRELAWYQLGGLFMHQAIGTFVQRHGTPVESLGAILDFGCGCGRILHWWGSLRDRCEIWGADYNPQLIAWCHRHLSSIARFTVNGADPPLDFPDDKFGFVYSYSVFTHLSEDRQKPWMKELVRVLKPGGLLLLTVHGRRVAWRAGFSPDMLRQMEERGVLVFGEDKSGTNHCGAYHSEAYMRGHESLGLELIDFMPGGVRDTSEQDMYLYRKV
jgi:SAM-dependent methyltransferase